MKKSLLFLFALSASSLLVNAGAPASDNSRTISKKLVKVAKNADDRTWKSIGEGEYSDAIMSNILRDFYNDPVKVTVEECEQTPGLYRVLNPWPEIMTDEVYYLVIDATDPEFVMIPEHISPLNDPENGEIHFRTINEWATTDMGFSKQQFLDSPLGNCNCVMKDKKIIIPDNALGLMWPDCDPVTGPADPGVWTISNGDYAGYLNLPGAESTEEWESIGKGRMLDGFVWPCFEAPGATPQEKEVEILANKEKKGYYKIVKPFLDTAPDSRDLIINASDPDFVKIELQNTGIKSEFGYAYIISLSASGFTSYDEMVAQDPAFAERNITLKDGMISIPARSVLFNFPESDNSIYDHELSQDGYIMMPEVGIDAIEDNSDATIQYFNLQGIPVTHPATGEIVIIRQGNKVSKSIAK